MIFRTILLTLFATIVYSLPAQELSELKSKKAEVEAQLKEKRAEAASLESELAGLQKQIDILAGWRFGFSGLIGLDLGQTNQWISSPNPTSSSSSLGIGITSFANREGKKYFWRSNLIMNKAWKDIDIEEGEDDNLFDQGTTDNLNLSSSGGYKLSNKFALSLSTALNSSISNFLEPGTFDIGLGSTWTPQKSLIVTVNPLNLQVAWSSDGEASSKGTLGTKLRVDNQEKFKVAGRKISWSSTLTTFIPYSSSKIEVRDVDAYGKPILDENGEVTMRQANLFEYTWLNTFSFQIWKGIGTGITFGLRRADFEFQELQSYYTMGLTYTL